jgi:glycerate-2-kinase
MKQLDQDARSIFNAGVDAVRARSLVRREVKIDGDFLCIGENCWSRKDFDRIIIIGAGKAATQMTAGLVEVIQSWSPYIGWINVPEGTVEPIAKITVHAARAAGLNEPSEAGVRGTQEILRMLRGATSRDLCIALISGGGSALLPAPIDGITLEDKLAVTRFLSAAGANINELNTVRKQLSAVKGGGLLRACRAGEMITIVLSDVLGDPLHLIASGPTVPDPSTAEEALAVLRRFDPNCKLPANIYGVLENHPRGSSPMTTRHHTFVIGNNAVAVDEAGIHAESLGYNHAMQSAKTCEGYAEEVGEHLAEMTLRMLRDDTGVDCLITGGEPTVHLADEAIRGRGGRNQQLVLAAYKRLLDSQMSNDEWDRLAILSGGTDGEDGPTDAAGAILSGDVHRRAVQLGLDVADHLRRNDAYSFFEKLGGLFITGPTGTNVCDIRVALVKHEKT